MSHLFDEDDFKALFGELKEEEKALAENVPVFIDPPKLKKKSRLFNRIALKFAALFGLIFIVSFVAINYLSLYDKFNYFWDTVIARKDYHRAVATPSVQTAVGVNPIAEAKLVIPKIGVSAPILWNVPEGEIDDKLLEGIVHYQGTALPGSAGNIFMTGHSSYYAWVSSPYKDVFALLEKVEPGDKIYIEYSGATLSYQVSDTKVVSPTEISVMDQTGPNRLTLMSCVPVGTNLNRLIVTALPVAN